MLLSVLLGRDDLSQVEFRSLSLNVITAKSDVIELLDSTIADITSAAMETRCLSTLCQEDMDILPDQMDL